MLHKLRDFFVLNKKRCVRLIAIVSAAVILVTALLVILLGAGNPKTVAKKFVQAQLEGDALAMYRVMAGDMQQYNEQLHKDDKEEMFTQTEEACAELGIEVTIDDFKQYYKAGRQLQTARWQDQYGADYKVTVKVREIEDMSAAALQEIQTRCGEADLAEYIRADKIKAGKYVVVDVIIEGDNETTTQNVRVYVVKYKSKWKVAYF